MLLFFEKTSSMSIVTRVLKIPSLQHPNTDTQSRQIHTFAEELILNMFSEHRELLTHWHSLPLHLAEGGNFKSERSKPPILLEDYQQHLAEQGLPGICGALHPCYVCSLCVKRDIMWSKLWQCHLVRGVFSSQLSATNEIARATDCKGEKHLQPRLGRLL